MQLAGMLSNRERCFYGKQISPEGGGGGGDKNKIAWNVHIPASEFWRESFSGTIIFKLII